MAHKWEIYKDKKGEYRARFKYNSEIMFFSEGYTSKASAMNAVLSCKSNGPSAEVVDNTGERRTRKKKPSPAPVTHRVAIGRNAMVVPMGQGVAMIAYSTDWNGLAGIMIKALPDDIADASKTGEPLNEEQIARIKEVEEYAPTVFLEFKDPDAVERLALQMIEWSDEWRERLSDRD
ncbi:DUF1508 domain-containing protein [Erythrobacter phage vB_EliS-L02]|nr:DUF1508 domain-containing protein [Erythrobacter phage vB_EliS-L02]